MQSLFHVLHFFQALTHVSEACSPLLDGCRKNRQKWQALAEQQENLINGESNQGKRNWDADSTSTSSSFHVGDTVIGEYCILLNTLWIWLMFCTAVLFFPHFKIEHDRVDAEVISEDSMFLLLHLSEMEEDLQVWFLLSHPTRRYWCRHWLCWEPVDLQMYIIV